MEKPQKELNLSEILMLMFKSVGNLIKWLWNVFVLALRLSYQKKWIISGFVLAGLVWGYLGTTEEKSIHKAAVNLRVIIKDSRFCREYIKTLNAYCNNNDVNDLANFLNMSVNDAKQLIAIESYYFVDIGKDGILDQVDYNDRFKGDTINTWSTNTLHIEILAKDKTIFPKVRDGIVFALNSNPSVQKEFTFLETQHLGWIDLFDEELQKIQDLQTRLFSSDALTSVSLRQKSKELRTDPNVMTFLGETKVQMFAGEKVQSMTIMNNHRRMIKEFNEGPIRVDLPIMYLGVVNPRHKVMIIRGFLAYLLGLGFCALLVNRKRIIAFLEA